MGTRHLIAVMIDGEYKVAQYGQWDGYPERQGVAALEILRSETTRERLRAGLSRVRWATDEEIKSAWVECGANPNSEFVDLATSKAFAKRYPELSRDTGAAILHVVATKSEPILLRNSIDFAGESLFCEWAYVVDFDKGTFEVFRGFNKKPLAEGERFAKAPVDADAEFEDASGKKDRYYGVRFVKAFKLEDLPNERDFLAAVNPSDEEEE